MTSKLSQQELRQMMRERAQSKAAKRIDSPLARYDEKNNLWCVACNVVIHSENVWSAHLIERAHKRKIEELKQQKQKPTTTITKLPANKSSNGLKRTLNADADEFAHPSKKVSKFENISEFSKKEISIKQNKATSIVADVSNDDDEDEKMEEESSVDINAVDTTAIDSSLPQDFFDSGVQPPSVQTSRTIIKQQQNKSTSEEDLSGGQTGTLPKGFFDDPKMDAKQRKVAKDELEEQMELFRKEIAQESIVSEVILEEEIEQLQKEKTLAEIDEQLEKWEKVDTYQKKIEEIHKKRQEEKTAGASKQQTDDSDEDDDEDLNDVNFWRSKTVFH